MTLANGADVLIRPAQAADADALQALFHHLSPDDVYTRFFRRVRSLSYEDLQAMCNVNHATQVAFLAVTGPRENEVVVASACYFLNSTSNLAEVAYMVAPEWQGLGLGKALQARLQEFAMARGVRGFVAEILANNERMVRLAAGAMGDFNHDARGRYAAGNHAVLGNRPALQVPCQGETDKGHNQAQSRALLGDVTGLDEFTWELTARSSASRMAA